VLEPTEDVPPELIVSMFVELVVKIPFLRVKVPETENGELSVTPELLLMVRLVNVSPPETLV
jgi:hypothetical protein